jgi:predicted Rossmann-fold nucleotide-binding protein
LKIIEKMKRISFFAVQVLESIVLHVASSLLGQALATHKIELVYGGANVGLMGAVADGVLNGGGTVIGVIPDF